MRTVIIRIIVVVGLLLFWIFALACLYHTVRFSILTFHDLINQHFPPAIFDIFETLVFGGAFIVLLRVFFRKMIPDIKHTLG